MLRFLSRSEIDTVAWDACVAGSAQRIVYGYPWYLDRVLSRPGWKWVGAVEVGETGAYRAVMPEPLRRKFGIWVVHQPLFCQFLDVFSPDEARDPTPFLRAVQQQYRYGSVLCLRPYSNPALDFDIVRQRTTHVLDLSAGYDIIRRNYTRDRQVNLRRATNHGWTITDPEPLLTLFRQYHATLPESTVAWETGRMTSCAGLFRYCRIESWQQFGAHYTTAGSKQVRCSCGKAIGSFTCSMPRRKPVGGAMPGRCSSTK